MSQSLSIRAMSFDLEIQFTKRAEKASQSLSIRAMSFDTVNTTDSDWGKASQSLSIRAMSFDSKFAVTGFGYQVSIPFDQGDVFRRNSLALLDKLIGLNPFRSGRCLSTLPHIEYGYLKYVSIPFDQGDVFRQKFLQQPSMAMEVSIPFDQGDVFRQ